MCQSSSLVLHVQGNVYYQNRLTIVMSTVISLFIVWVNVYKNKENYTFMNFPYFVVHNLNTEVNNYFRFQPLRVERNL